METDLKGKQLPVHTVFGFNWLKVGDVWQTIALLMFYNNNHNSTWDNVYGAVMSQVIARVHPVHLTNVGQCQAAADPQTKPTDLGCESACRLLLPTYIIAIYYYSARKLILIILSYEGWKAEST